MQFTGQSPHEAALTDWFTSVHPDDQDDCRALYENGFETSSAYEAEFRLRRHDGQYRWFLAKCSPVMFRQDTQGFVGCCIDVTDRRESELERIRLVELLGSAVSRSSRLQRLTAGLAPLVDEQEVANYALEVGIEALGGNAGSLCLLIPPDLMQVVAARGYPDNLVRQWSTFSVNGHFPASQVTLSGRPIFIESPEQRAELFPDLGDDPSRPSRAYAVMPLIPYATVPMGALIIGFEDSRSFEADDIALLRTFADQCAIALERARLYREAQHARDRWAFLAEVSSALGTSLELETMLANLVDLAVPRVADWAAVHLVENQRLRSVHARHLTPEQTERFREMLDRFPPRIDGLLGPGSVIRTRRSSIHTVLSAAELHAIATDAEHFELLREIGFGSAAFLPLMASDRVQGVLVLGRDSGQPLTSDDVALADELARRASSALHNSLLYRERSEIARALQASLLPPSLPEIEGLDLAARYSPAGSGAEVGGDFYDLKHLSPGRWLAVLGDVCGTGIEAASMTGLARHALQSAALEYRQPSAILSMANEMLVRDADDRAGPEHTRRFCTVVALQLESTDHGFDLTVCCAGHPQPVLMDQGGHARTVGADGTLLGVFKQVSLHDVRTRLRSGDILVAFTDGVTERRRGSEFFDVAGIEQVLRDHLDDDADTIAGALEAAVSSFSNRPLSDDMALLVIKAR